MNEYKRPIQLRWADLDPNFHVRHSAYYDYAANIRTEFISNNGVTPKLMIKEHFGPVLFREEAVFKREIHYGDDLSINLKLLKVKRDYSRFSFVHEIIKADGTVAAVITVDGAWIDTHLRKLTKPPEVVIAMTEAAPKHENFEWVD